MSRALLLVALALASCGPDEPAPDLEAAPAVEDARPAPVDSVSPFPQTPFDAADAVFDTIEPPEQVVQFPPRPTPRPIPRPIPPRPSPPPPPADNPAGSCDVRQSEGYCLAFAGRGWTPGEARDVCDAAPDASFGPGACPLADRIATCAFDQPSAPGQEIVYTYYAPYDPALAELACPGRFTRID